MMNDVLLPITLHRACNEHGTDELNCSTHYIHNTINIKLHLIVVINKREGTNKCSRLSSGFRYWSDALLQ